MSWRPRFRFLRKSNAHDFEAEFRAVYQEPGVRLLAQACSVAAFVFGIFYLLDATSAGFGYFGGIQTFRFVVVASLLAFVAFLHLFRDAALKHYTTIAIVSITLAMQAAGWVSYAARRQFSDVEVYWALTSSFETAIVLAFGFSRLTAWTTLLVTLGGTLTAIGYAVTLSGHAQQLGRLITHLVVATSACYLLRLTIESRERRLFIQGKEVLDKAVYTHRLEVARLAAVEADQAKSRFLASMSHEVRTPMNAVLQILEVVRDKLAPSERQLVDRGRASGQALLRVLNTILDYTKLSAGGSPLHMSSVNLSDLIRTVSELFEASAVAKGIALRTEVEIPKGLERVTTDEVKVVEILNNLVSNAIKATAKGHVRISVGAHQSPLEPESVEVFLEVADTGIGIPKEDQLSLFEAFYQGGPLTEGKPVGTGLGLAIVQQLAQLLRGEVSVESEPGTGSRFRVNFRAKIAPAFQPASLDDSSRRPSQIGALAGEDAPSRTSVPTLHSMRLKVLLAEDHEINAELAKIFLESFGCTVTHALDGQEAIQRYQSGTFDIVLMDCLMPVCDGFTATIRIRAFEKEHMRPRIPIIAVTANTLVGDRDHCLGVGMDDFLPKPYSRDDLSVMLSRWSKVKPAQMAPTSA